MKSRLRQTLEAAAPREQAALMRALRPETRAFITRDFGWRSHGGQRPPPGDWRVWAIIAGRGFGKTRAGAEWVLGLVRPSTGALDASLSSALSPRSGQADLRIALVAATIDEARAVMVEGPSGILACARPGEVLDWHPGTRTIRFRGGAEATLFSGASPEKLRGPEHDFAWCDELCKWPCAQETWDNLQLGLRRGVRPRVLITTTPRSGPMLDAILDQPDAVRRNGSTYDNPFTAPAFKEAVTRIYGGTRLGAQELYGEILRDVEGSLWPGKLVERCRVATVTPAEAGACLKSWPPTPTEAPASAGATSAFSRIVIGVDPPASVNGTCGIVVCGKDEAGLAYVIADESISGASPEGWARAVAEAFVRYEADRVVVEINQGGDMVASTLKACSVTLPIEQVRAVRGKTVRAEPVAGLFENGRAFFCGRFPALEEELGGLTTGGRYQGPGTSPDRADAMVWALWALMLKPKRPEPRIRQL